MSNCRRCSECQGQEHHWSTEIRTDDGLRLQCKHCEATADDCEPCMGTGEDVERFDGQCFECRGTGIVDVRP